MCDYAEGVKEIRWGKYLITPLDPRGRRVYIKADEKENGYEISAEQAVRDGIDIPWIKSAVLPISGCGADYRHGMRAAKNSTRGAS